MPPTRESSTLEALLAPRTVAVIGASATPGKATARPVAFMQRHGFAGHIYPVNPQREAVMGLPSYASIRAIPDSIDHAYILLEQDAAIAAVEECARARVKVVSVLSDGFAEAGPEGRRRQDRLVAIATAANILLIGPNSTGVISPPSGFSCTTNAAFGTDVLRKGKLAVLSQSGSLIGTIVSRGEARGIGYSALISVGNEASAGIGELGQLLLDDPNTQGFVLFMETIRNADAIATFARRAAAEGKPVCAYLIGQSEEGQALSVSHTGALTGSTRAARAFLQFIGIHLLERLDTLIEAPNALTMAHRPRGRPASVTVLSTTGGGGAMIVDQISARGSPISGCSDSSRTQLQSEGITLGHGKLVDVTLAGTQYATMKKVVSTLLADPDTGLLLVIVGSSAQFNPELSVKPVIDALQEAPQDRAAIMAVPLPHAPESITLFEAGGIPAFSTPESCAETVGMLLSPLVIAPSLPAAPLSSVTCNLLNGGRPGILDEVDSGAIFATLNIKSPPHCVLEPGQDLPTALPFAFPVVAKLISPDLPHKTEAGAVRLNIQNHASLCRAIDDMSRAAKAHTPGFRHRGVLIQEMSQGVGEVLVGLTRDPLVGPVVTVGMGGIMTEIYQDTAVRPAPVSEATAREMLNEIKGLAVLNGFRGKPPGDLKALAAAVSAVSRLALSDRVVEAEINPLLVKEHGKGVVLLDALIKLQSEPPSAADTPS